MSAMEEVIHLLDNILNDRGVPKNVKESVEESLQMLRSGSDNDVKVAEAAAVLDDVSNDPNLTSYGRTLLWNAITKLEELK